jgi:hypothetical protein
MNQTRIFKPLPTVRPEVLDDISRQHLLNLLNRWLLNEQIPLKPWSNVIYELMINFCEKAFNGRTAIPKNKILVETISSNVPGDSKFLVNAIQEQVKGFRLHSTFY